LGLLYGREGQSGILGIPAVRVCPRGSRETSQDALRCKGNPGSAELTLLRAIVVALVLGADGQPRGDPDCKSQSLKKEQAWETRAARKTRKRTSSSRCRNRNKRRRRSKTKPRPRGPSSENRVRARRLRPLAAGGWRRPWGPPWRTASAVEQSDRISGSVRWAGRRR